MERKFLDTILDDSKMVLDPLHETLRENTKVILLKNYGTNINKNADSLKPAIEGIKTTVETFLKMHKKSKSEIKRFMTIVEQKMEEVRKNEDELMGVVDKFKEDNPDYDTNISVFDFLNREDTPDEILDAHEKHLVGLNNVIRILLNPAADGEPVGDEFFASLNPIIQEVE